GHRGGVGQGPPHARGAGADQRQVEAAHRPAFPASLAGVLQGTRPETSRPRPRVRRDRRRRGRRDRRRERAGDRPRDDQEGAPRTRRGSEGLRLVPRFPPIRERPARRLRDGHGATHPVDLQARTHPRCSALPADARPLLSVVRILLGPHRLFGRMGDLPEDDPFAALLADHADFVDKLTELEATLDEMMATRDASEENEILLDESVRFFEEELLPVLAAEDEVLLAPLEKAIGRYGTLVNVVGYEHDEIRRGVDKFRAATRELEADASWPASFPSASHRFTASHRSPLRRSAAATFLAVSRIGPELSFGNSASEAAWAFGITRA